MTAGDQGSTPAMYPHFTVGPHFSTGMSADKDFQIFELLDPGLPGASHRGCRVGCGCKQTNSDSLGFDENVFLAWKWKWGMTINGNKQPDSGARCVGMEKSTNATHFISSYPSLRRSNDDVSLVSRRLGRNVRDLPDIVGIQSRV